jgi:hypothetical protein
MTPNKENILKWVLELESGRWPQAHGYLVNYIGYCCLGVCQKLFDGLKEPNDLAYGNKDLSLYETSQVSDKTAQALGLNQNEFEKYANMNDNRKSFCEIARQIRSDFGLGV